MIDGRKQKSPGQRPGNKEVYRFWHMFLFSALAENKNRDKTLKYKIL